MTLIKVRGLQLKLEIGLYMGLGYVQLCILIRCCKTSSFEFLFRMVLKVMAKLNVVIKSIHGMKRCINKQGDFDCKCRRRFSGNGFDCENINECNKPNVIRHCQRREKASLRTAKTRLIFVKTFFILTRSSSVVSQ